MDIVYHCISLQNTESYTHIEKYPDIRNLLGEVNLEGKSVSKSYGSS